MERIAMGLEGANRSRVDDGYYYRIGRALRKKKLEPEDKLTMLSATRVPEIRRTVDTIARKKKPYNKDVVSIQEKLQRLEKQPKQQPKTKGTKPTPTTIEEKKQRLTQKYGVK